MKRIVLIAVVLAAVTGVIVLKKSKADASREKGSTLCPCKMIEAAHSNQTNTGAETVE